MRAIEIARGQRTRTFELRAALSLAKLRQTTGREKVASELLVAALVALAGATLGPFVRSPANADSDALPAPVPVSAH